VCRRRLLLVFDDEPGCEGRAGLEGLGDAFAAAVDEQYERVAGGPARQVDDLLDETGELGGALVGAGISADPGDRCPGDGSRGGARGRVGRGPAERCGVARELTPTKRRPITCTFVPSWVISRSELVVLIDPDAGRSSTSSPPAAIPTLRVTGADAPVETFRVVLRFDSLPAASRAETWKVYALAGARPVSTWLVSVTSVVPPGPYTR
jgi:hypothetical protein